MDKEKWKKLETSEIKAKEEARKTISVDYEPQLKIVIKFYICTRGFAPCIYKVILF